MSWHSGTGAEDEEEHSTRFSCSWCWSGHSWRAPGTPSATALRTTASGARKILYYVDPMHPAYKSDKPGIAPDCGMELVPVYEDGSMGGAGGAAGMPPGTVNVSPEKQQLIGVKVATVEKAPGTHTLRVLGRVVPDETRLYRINSATDGWVKKILPRHHRQPGPEGRTAGHLLCARSSSRRCGPTSLACDRWTGSRRAARRPRSSSSRPVPTSRTTGIPSATWG